MALIKGFNVINKVKGKIGNIVVQRGVYGESVVRAYTSEVKNPKTIAQANQRMKAAPTQYARREMKNIIDHAFEGIAYGTKSVNHFVSLAMKGDAAPAQLKGDMRFIPGKYQISSGSLYPIVLAYGVESDLFLANVSMGDLEGMAPRNLGAFSTALIENNQIFKEGDRLTFCYCVEVYNSSGKAFYDFRYDRIVLSKSSTDALPSYITNGKVVDSLGNEFDTFAISPELDSSQIIVACAVVVSRQSGTNWLRSDATMALSAVFEEQYFSPTAIESAIASYTAVDKATFSDWYMNQGEVNILRFGTARVADLFSSYSGTEQANIVIPTAIIVEDGQQKVACFEKGDGIVGLDGKTITFKDQQGGEGVVDPRALNPGYVVLEWSDDYLGKF